MADRYLSDDDLRILVDRPTAVWAPGVQQRVAVELRTARARIAELENQVQLLEGLDPDHA